MNETKILLEHNIKTYKDAKEVLNNNRSVAIVQPTGTGKSYIMMQFMHDYECDWKIIVAPSRLFLDSIQTNKFWVTNRTFCITYSWLVSNRDKLEEKLRELGIDLQGKGLIVLDETCRAGAKEWYGAVLKLLELCSNFKVLGLSATMSTYRSKNNVMETIYNNRVISNMTITKAVDMEVIPKMTYVISLLHIPYSLEHLENIVKNNKCYKMLEGYIETIRESWEFETYFVRTLNKYLDKNNGSNKHIVYVRTIEEIDQIEPMIKRAFKEVYPNRKVRVYKMHSNLPEGENKRLLGEFQDAEDEVSVAVTVNMLNESHHINGVGSIILFRGTNSPNSYIQRIGRALCANGNSPIVFDFADNIYSVGEVFSHFNIKRKDDKIERIDFNNKEWFSKKARKFNIDASIDNGLFEKIIDEAGEIENSIRYILSLCSTTNEETMRVLKDILDKTECGTIFGIKDNDEFEWCKRVIEHKKDKDLTDKEKDIYFKYSELTSLSEYILNIAGKQWYDLYKLIIEGKASKKQIETFRNYNIEKFARNLINKNLSNKIKEHTCIDSDILDDKEEVKVFYNKHKDKLKDIIVSRIEWLTVENVTRNPYLYNKTCTSIESLLCNVKFVGKHYTKEETPMLFAYRYYLLVKKDIDKYLENNPVEVKDLELFEMVNKIVDYGSKKLTYLPIEMLKQINERILSLECLDDLPEHVVEYIQFRDLNNLSRLKDNALKAASIFAESKNIRDKIDYALINRELGSDTIESIDRTYKSLVKDYSDYKWHEDIQREFNSLVDWVENIRKYVNGELSEPLRYGIDEYADRLRLARKMEKSRKNYATGIIIENECLGNATKRYSDISEFKKVVDNKTFREINGRLKELQAEFIESMAYDKINYNGILNCVALVKVFITNKMYEFESVAIPREIKKAFGVVINHYDIVIKNKELVIYSEYKCVKQFIEDLDNAQLVYLAGCTLGFSERKFYIRRLSSLYNREILDYQDEVRLVNILNRNYGKPFGIILSNDEMCHNNKVLDYIRTFA